MAIVRSPLSRLSDFEVFRSRNARFVDELAALRKYRTARLAILQSLSRRTQRSMVRALFTDDRLLRLYAYEALRKSGHLRRATVETVAEMATEANLFQPCLEHSPRHPVRSRRRFRDVYNFGPQKRLRQLLVADVIRPLHPPRQSQKLLHGGMPAARRAVEAAFHEGVMRFCAEIDLVDFYGSVPLEGLAGVLRPLPAGVIRHVVFDLTIRRSYEEGSPSGLSTGAWSDPHRIGPIGLPLGSACSPVVGECILAQFVQEIPDDQFITYADNILLLGRTEEDVQALTESLAAALHNGSGSMRYRVRTNSVVAMQTGFEFLGQQVDIAESDGKFTWRPASHKVAEYLIGDWPVQANLPETDEAEAKVINWRAAYPDWPEGDAVEAHALAEIACIRHFQQRSGVSRRRAISAILDAILAYDYLLSIDEIVPDGGPLHGAERDRLIHACVNRFPEAEEASQ